MHFSKLIWETLRRAKTRNNSRTYSPLIQPTRPLVEVLEDRTLPAPVIINNTADLPDTATSLTIAGSGFDTVISNDSVGFSNGVTGSVTAATGTSLTVSLTGFNMVTSGYSVNAVVTVDGVASNTAYVATAAPVVTSSTAGLPVNATSLTIGGSGFDTNASSDSVTFNNGVTGSVTAATRTSLTVALTGFDTMTVGSALNAVATADATTSGAAVQVATAAPVVTLNNASLPVNATSLTIGGEGFDTNAANDSVTFNNGVTGSVTAATATSLTVNVSGFNTFTGGSALYAIATVDGANSGAQTQVATAAPTVTLNGAGLPINATSLTIGGLGFDTNAANDSVTFNNSVTGIVTAATATSLTVNVSGFNTFTGGSALYTVVTVDGTNSGSPQQVASAAPVVTSNTASLPVNATSLTIGGLGFDPNSIEDSVTFNNGVTGSVTAATGTSLTVTLTGLNTQTGGSALNAVVLTNGVPNGSAVQVATLAPVVTSSTASLPVNATSLTIAGSGFDTNAANDSVTFNNGVTGSVTAATGSTLTVTLNGLTTFTGGSALNAVVTVDGANSGNAVQVATAAPAITTSTASLPVTSRTLTISGSGFDNNLANDSVNFNDGVTGSITAATSSSLTVSVTGVNLLTGGEALDAIATVDGTSSGSLTQVATVAPVVTSSTTSLPVTSTILTIAGSGFDTNAANDSVTFNGGVMGSVTAATASSLTVTLTGLSTETAGTALNAVVTVHGTNSGNPVEVASLGPVVTTSTAPLPVTASRLTIGGFGFDTTIANDTVTFGSGVTGSVTAATATSLTVALSGLSSVTGGTAVNATVTVDGTSSGNAVEVAVAAPVVKVNTSVLPATATSLTISGTGFDSHTANDIVSFDNGVTGSVTGASSTTLTVSVSGLSKLAAGTALNASVTVDGTTSGSRVQVASISAATSPTPIVTVGVITGVVFIDHKGTGVFSSGDLALAGVTVTISGVATNGTSVQDSVVTDADGNFTFVNVLPGTYELSTPAQSGLLGSGTSTSVSVNEGVTVTAVTLPAGQTVGQNLGYQGLASTAISERLLLSTTHSTDFPDASNTPGTGTISLSGPNVGLGIADINATENSNGPTIDLAGAFADANYADSTITFNTNIGALTVTLYDAQAPQTVANFFDYIDSGAYDDSIFSRLVSNFVLQGGGATIDSSPDGDVVGFSAINPLAAIPNEFQSFNSNVFGTLAMAQSAGNPNSATDQFFFNIANNASSLDSQSFTVFGAVTGANDRAFLTNLNNLVTNNPAQYAQDESSSAVASGLPSVLLNSVPLPGYTGGSSNFPQATTLSNYILINSITVNSRPEYLTYKVLNNTNPNLVTTTLTNEQLALNYTANMTGSATITVQATNQNGAAVTTSFTVTVK